MGKTETKLPKSKAARDTEFGQLRFQCYDDGKIHIHDDDAGLLFTYQNKRKFQSAMDEFVRNRHKYPIGSVLAMRGDTTQANIKLTPPVTPAKQKPADMVLTRTALKWEMRLEEAGKIVADAILNDEVAMFLDDWVQQI